MYDDGSALFFTLAVVLFFIGLSMPKGVKTDERY